MLKLYAAERGRRAAAARVLANHAILQELIVKCDDGLRRRARDGLRLKRGEEHRGRGGKWCDGEQSPLL
jgi:hypothetical protein